MAKLADCPGVEVQVEILADPEAVWDLISDLDTPAAFSNEYRGGVWVDSAEPGVGARFDGRNERDDRGAWTQACVVTEWEPGRAFAWLTGEPEKPGARWRYDIEAGADGRGCLLRHAGNVGPGPSGLADVIEKLPNLEEKILEGRLAELKANMAATLDGIKRLAERG